MAMGPDGARNQEALCWREPAAIYGTGLFCTDFHFLVCVIYTRKYCDRENVDLGKLTGLHVSVVGYVGRSPVRFSMRSLNFSIDLILPAALWPRCRLSLTEMRTRNISGGKGRPARGADNLTSICEPFI
jgi:hypothetical protein